MSKLLERLEGLNEDVDAVLIDVKDLRKCILLVEILENGGYAHESDNIRKLLE